MTPAKIREETCPLDSPTPRGTTTRSCSTRYGRRSAHPDRRCTTPQRSCCWSARSRPATSAISCSRTGVSRHLLQVGRTRTQIFRHTLKILREDVLAAEPIARTSTLRTVYEHLAEHDRPAAESHRDRAAYWRVQEELLTQERLFMHDADRQSFEVYWHHYTRVRSLPCDLSYDAIMTPYEGNPTAIPDPVAFDALGRPTHLSGAFLRLGHTLLHLRPSSNGHDEERARINLLAHENIDPLYALLISRADVPPELRRLFEQQRKRFEEM